MLRFEQVRAICMTNWLLGSPLKHINRTAVVLKETIHTTEILIPYTIFLIVLITTYIECNMAPILFKNPQARSSYF